MTQGTTDHRPTLFDEPKIAGRRDRSAALGFAGGGDFLHREVAELTRERLDDVTRPFGETVIIGSGGGAYGAALAGRIEGAVRTIELSPARARMSGADAVSSLEVLPLEAGCADLVISGLELHWANDPVGQLVQMRRALRPDGLMIAALFGGQTLHELRACLAEAEVQTSGGLSPRVAPMGELRELGGLLQRAGFAMPVADAERIETSYTSMIHLMHDLRAMGETNILSGRRKGMMPRALLHRAAEIYASTFATGDGRVRATFEIVFLTGWAPAESQPKPLRPGSATARLADALGTTEISAGEVSTPAAPRLKD